MSSQIKPSPALLDCIHKLRTTVRQFTELLDTLIAITCDLGFAKSMRKENITIPDQIKQTLPLMLMAAGSSSHTLLQLSELPGLQTRDCFSIARSIIEISVNICYIIAEGSDAAERALRHARQKSYKDLERESKIGGTVIRLAYSGIPDPLSLEKLQEDILEFTTRTGKEKGWVDSSIDERIKIAGQKLGGSILTSLHFARFMIYRHSSEVLHGTLFSALHFFGMTLPTNQPRTQDEMAESIGQHLMLILHATILVLSSIVEAFHRAYGFLALFDKSKLLLNSLREIEYFRPKK